MSKKSMPLPFKGTSKKLHIALLLWLKFSHVATANCKSDNQEKLCFGLASSTQLRIEVVITRKKRKMSSGGKLAIYAVVFIFIFKYCNIY